MSKLLIPKTTTAYREGAVPKVGDLLFDTEQKRVVVGDGETPGGIPLRVASNEKAFVYGVDVDKYTTTSGVNAPVSSTSRTKVVLNHDYDYEGANTSLRYHAVESFAQTPAHSFHAVLRDLERGRDVCSLDISDYRKKADGTALTEQQRRGFWIENGEKRLVDFATRVGQFYYRFDHYDVTVNDVVHHHTVKLISNEPFVDAVLHPGFYDGGSILTLDSGRQYERYCFGDNGTTAYAWRHGGSDTVYTKSASPAAGDTVYSNNAATTDSGKKVESFVPGGSTPSDIYFMIYDGVLCDSDGVPKEQSADGTPVSRAATDRLRSIQGYRPATNTTRAYFRVNAANEFSNLKSLLAHEALELLLEIDLGNINFQAGLSIGLCNCSVWNYASVRKTGRSASFGNSTISYNGSTPIRPEILADEDASTITVGGVIYTRDTTADSGSAKAWVNGANTVYTKFEVPTVYVAASGSGATAVPAFGDMAYTNADLTAGAAAITDVTGLDYDFLHMNSGANIWNAGAQSDHSKRVVSFSWRGIENVWGEIWEFMDGCQKYQDAVVGDFTNSGYWTTNDTDLYISLDTDKGAGQYGEKFPTRGYTGDSVAWVWHPWPKAAGYIKEYDDFTYLCITTGGGETTYFGDYFYNDANAGARVLFVGGRAGHGGDDGAGCVCAGNALSYSHSNIGARQTARADMGTDHLAEGSNS